MADNFKPCSVIDCNGNAHRSAFGCRDMCSVHYQRWRVHGDPLIRTKRRYHRDNKCAVDGCARMASDGRRGYCAPHYKRLWRHGNPTAGGTAKGAVIDWLHSHVDYAGDECLIWPFARDKTGYALVDKKAGSGVAAHVMCVSAHGEPPTPDHECSHSCGKGADGCVNPTHLRWLTHADNMAETLIHGTHNRGEQNGMSFLTEGDVRRIRILGDSMEQKEIAEMFGISPPHVSDIINRKAWAWLD